MACALALAGCTNAADEVVGPPPETAGYFHMPDGTDIPYRAWLPDPALYPPTGGKDDAPSASVHAQTSAALPSPAIARSVGRSYACVPATAADGKSALPSDNTSPIVILALHGMNDSRDAWEYAAPAFAAAGIIVISPDLRGFGASPSRGFWPGTDRLVDDTREELGQIRARYPRSPIVGMAESMGAAILMVMATRSAPTDGAGAEVDRYVLLAPAVWGRSEMNIPMRALLWMMNGIAPGLRLTNGGVVKVTASDNRAALVRLSTDPLTLHATRVDAVKGLVDLMDAAQDAAPHLPPSAMVLYGGHDELIPPAAMRAAWQSMPTDVVRAFYPDGYHLLLRDNGRNATIADILSWLRDPCAPLPSGAEAAARAWLQTDIDRDAH